MILNTTTDLSSLGDPLDWTHEEVLYPASLWCGRQSMMWCFRHCWTRTEHERRTTPWTMDCTNCTTFVVCWWIKSTAWWTYRLWLDRNSITVTPATSPRDCNHTDLLCPWLTLLKTVASFLVPNQSTNRFWSTFVGVRFNVGQEHWNAAWWLRPIQWMPVTHVQEMDLVSCTAVFLYENMGCSGVIISTISTGWVQKVAP